MFEVSLILLYSNFEENVCIFKILFGSFDITNKMVFLH